MMFKAEKLDYDRFTEKLKEISSHMIGGTLLEKNIDYIIKHITKSQRNEMVKICNRYSEIEEFKEAFDGTECHWSNSSYGIITEKAKKYLILNKELLNDLLRHKEEKENIRSEIIDSIKDESEKKVIDGQTFYLL